MGPQRQTDLEPGQVLYQFVGAFVDELARSGVQHVCICPGSRSTPLTLLLRKHPSIRVWVHLDERSAAFFALGMGKALGEPAAVVSTSGTAAVNFAPAVVEARYSRVPLLVLTADRPPELRDVGANQTIDQLHLYGRHAKWFVEMLLPEASPEAVRYARAVACRAAATARASVPGPVHINFPFREPLIPVVPPPGLSEGAAEGDSRAPYVAVQQVLRRPHPAELVPLAAELRAAARGIIVCGPQDGPRFPEAVARLAQELDFPILADPMSQVRCGLHHSPRIIDSYDAFLRDAATAEALRPDVVLRFGATPVSRPILTYLQRHPRACQILVGECGWNDPALIARQAIEADARSLCEDLLEALRRGGRPTGAEQSDWSLRWQRTNQRARAALQARLAGEPGLSEPGVFLELARLLPAGGTLFVGNSMPVRDLDTVFPGCGRPIRFLANRGASGIDGVTSTALGVSAVSDAPLVLVIGDLSFYHDMNGLLAARCHGLRATIVLLHNDGGGIFSLLPQADDPEHFEELFGTPHGLDFRPAAEMYGLTYQRADGWEDFRRAVRESMASSSTAVVEVRTERAANARLHHELWRAVSQALREHADKGTTR